MLLCFLCIRPYLRFCGLPVNLSASSSVPMPTMQRSATNESNRIRIALNSENFKIRTLRTSSQKFAENAETTHQSISTPRRQTWHTSDQIQLYFDDGAASSTSTSPNQHDVNTEYAFLEASTSSVILLPASSLQPSPPINWTYWCPCKECGWTQVPKSTDRHAHWK
jgi:hypothetical protein